MATTAALGYTTTTTHTGGGESEAVTAAAAAAFTRAQWKELERQAMIYKYMVASVPVPPHLLSSDFSPTVSYGYNGCSSLSMLKYGNNKDIEPWRCKRTDGKKWRCSRDVAPNQKYCERHMHRGRPRSRKPVEQQQQQQPSLSHNTKKTRLHPPATAAPPPQLLDGSAVEIENNNPSSVLVKNVTKIEDVSLSLFSHHSNTREMEWTMESKIMTSEQQWHELMSQGSVYNTSTTNPPIFQQDNYGEEQQLSLLSLPEIGNTNTDEYNLFLNQYNPPRDFIDAWSNDNNNSLSEAACKNDSSCGINNGNLSPCCLNLSMAMGASDSLDDEMSQIRMGEVSDTSHKCHGLSWLSPVSWMASEPGGPLAEVLRPSNVAVHSNPGSPYVENTSPPETSASSPTGVLQKNMLSLSDSSVCNSPTAAAASTAAPVFQWLN